MTCNSVVGPVLPLEIHTLSLLLLPVLLVVLTMLFVPMMMIGVEDFFVGRGVAIVVVAVEKPLNRSG